ncbi:MAG: GDP-mannose 4,6-dehydratase [Bacteroidia bacterium]|nr:GDP-mannose 4,6-dehydratase [Bacteroidia bacterium]
MVKILITGTAGFIGFHTTRHLLKQNYSIIGLDNLSSHPENNLNLKRLKELGINTDNISYNKLIENKNLAFIQLDIKDKENLSKLFHKYKFDIVIHLAARTGVRYSIHNPQAYIDDNIHGFINLLECCHNAKVKKLIYASSSSVYGNLSKMPYCENNLVDSPVSVYAATKRADELFAYTYSQLYGIQSIGLRFFTVYGPWVRIDMAAYLFMKAIAGGTCLELFNEGDMLRDFTYVDDVVQCINLIITKMLNEKELHPHEQFLIFNVGNSKPYTLVEFLSYIEKSLCKKAEIKYLPLQDGDMKATYADITEFFNYTGYKPSTDLKTGVNEMVKWFNTYCQNV